MGIETAILIGGAALSAGSALNQGAQSRAQGYQNQAMAEIDAKQAIEDSIKTAKLVRKQREVVKSSANTAVAASGLDVNSKTARLIQDDINANSDQDIYQTMVNGQQTAARYRQQGKAYARAGNDAYNASQLQAGSTALSAYGSYRRGWK